MYDYTCLELLQGISIPELTSLDGKKWRNKYENPTNGYSELDKEVWPGVFERMENFIKDTNLKLEDVELEYCSSNCTILAKIGFYLYRR